jgi:hypothetical protein
MKHASTTYASLLLIACFGCLAICGCSGSENPAAPLPTIDSPGATVAVEGCPTLEDVVEEIWMAIYLECGFPEEYEKHSDYVHCRNNILRREMEKYDGCFSLGEVTNGVSEYHVGDGWTARDDGGPRTKVKFQNQ